MSYSQDLKNLFILLCNKTQLFIYNTFKNSLDKLKTVTKSISNKNVFSFGSEKYTSFIYHNHICFVILIFILVSFLKFFSMKKELENKIHVPFYKNKKRKHWNCYNFYSLLFFIASWMYYVIHYIINEIKEPKILEIKYNISIGIIFIFISIFYILLLAILINTIYNLSLTLQIGMYIISFIFVFSLKKSLIMTILFIYILFCEIMMIFDSIFNFYDYSKKLSHQIFKNFLFFSGFFAFISSVFFFFFIIAIRIISEQRYFDLTWDEIIIQNLSLLFLIFWTFRLLCKIYSAFCCSMFYLESVQSYENKFKKSLHTVFTIIPQLSLSTFFSTFYYFSVFYIFLSIFYSSNSDIFTPKILLFIGLIFFIFLLQIIHQEDTILPYIAIYDGNFNFTTFEKSDKRIDHILTSAFPMIITKLILKKIVIIITYITLSLIIYFLGLSNDIVLEINLLESNSVEYLCSILKIFFTFIFLIFIETFLIGYYTIYYYLSDKKELENREN